MSSKSQFSLEYTHKVIFQDVPLAWTTRFELFTPDLEQFPLMYIHRLIDNERVFGFPVAINSSQKTGKLADIEVTFLCNRPQGNGLYDSAIRDELANRIGLSNAVEIGDLDSICVGKPQYKDMLLDLWDGRIDKVYGGKIPHGRIYDEIFGIVRFSASGVAPRLGKTSELRTSINGTGMILVEVPIDTVLFLLCDTLTLLLLVLQLSSITFLLAVSTAQ